jgi:hypothetical protein
MEREHRHDRYLRGNHRPVARGRLAIAVALAAILLLSGCAGIGNGYSKQDIRRDALQLVPPGARHVGVNVFVGDGFNPEMSASVTFQARSGTEKQRIAEYLAIARRHGWTVTPSSITNAHAYLVIHTNWGLAPRADMFYLVMQ